MSALVLVASLLAIEVALKPVHVSVVRDPATPTAPAHAEALEAALAREIAGRPYLVRVDDPNASTLEVTYAKRDDSWYVSIRLDGEDQGIVGCERCTPEALSATVVEASTEAFELLRRAAEREAEMSEATPEPEPVTEATPTDASTADPATAEGNAPGIPVPPPPVAPTPARAPPPRLELKGGVGLGVGLVGLGAIAVGVPLLLREPEIRGRPGYIETRDLQPTSVALLAAGTGLAVFGAALLVWDLADGSKAGRRDRKHAAAPMLGPHVAGLSFTLSFATLDSPVTPAEAPAAAGRRPRTRHRCTASMPRRRLPP